MNNRVLILVEGQTEETFVRDVLTPYFQGRNIYLIPTLVVTKKVKIGPRFKGGITSYTKVRKDVLSLLGDTDAIAVTTMLDYYGLPDDFPGKSTITTGNCYTRVTSLEKAFSDNIPDPRFIPYLSLHEFESFLFVSPFYCASAFPNLQIHQSIASIKNQFASPEEINEGKETHPSARIEKIIPTYRKALHGPLITKRIGIPALKQECKHFKEWLDKLEF